MLLELIIIDADIIHIYNIYDIQETFKSLINIYLEDGRSINESE
jgi:hypothetical protein